MTLQQTVASISLSATASAKDRTRHQGLVAGLQILEHMANQTLPNSAAQILDTFFSKLWPSHCRDIVRNSLADDLHFLPPESHIDTYSAIVAPSVALLRYPLTVPTVSLQAILSAPSDAWKSRLSSACRSPGLAGAFGNQQPMRVIALQHEFLTDLLARFARLFIRLGSSDFSDEAVQVLTTAIREGSACNS
jgi:hypothetical protein